MICQHIFFFTKLLIDIKQMKNIIDCNLSEILKKF